MCLRSRTQLECKLQENDSTEASCDLRGRGKGQGLQECSECKSEEHELNAELFAVEGAQGVEQD